MNREIQPVPSSTSIFNICILGEIVQRTIHIKNVRFFSINFANKLSSIHQIVLVLFQVIFYFGKSVKYRHPR